MTNQAVRVRFAPSPTGFLHVGGARTAFFNLLFARRHEGAFLLRIEDTDQDRCRPEFYDDILSGLRWLGLEWDEGPEVGGPFAPYIQSQRREVYAAHAAQLVEKGLAYWCCCTPERLAHLRKEQELRKQPTGYDRRCRGLSPAQRQELETQRLPRTVRFATPLDGETAFDDVIRGRIVFQNSQLDDFIILKSDGFPTYHLANVVDDHLMQISHVIRGEEWISSTPRHALLYEAFGWQPPAFAHLPLIVGPDRQKLSKRHGAASVEEYRKAGYLPQALTNFLALLGWSSPQEREVLSRQDLVEQFSLERVNPSPAIFDRSKLDWLNGTYIRSLSPEQLLEAALPFMQESGLVATPASHDDSEYAKKVLLLEQERMKVLSDAPKLASFFFGNEVEIERAAAEKWLRAESVRQALGELAERLEGLEQWDVASIEAALRSLAQEKGLKAAELIHPTRVSVTGRTAGPGLFETLHTLGRERTVLRLRRAVERHS
jgi:glutamyl-tRNA synthetase